MSEQMLTCPNCKSKIPLTDVLTSQIAEKLRAEIESETKIKEKELFEKQKALLKKEDSIDKTISEKLLTERNNLKKELSNEWESKFSLEISDLNAKLLEQKTTNEKLKNAELNARKTKRELDEIKESFKQDLEVELKKSEDNIKNKVKSEYEAKKKDELREIELDKKLLDEKLSSLQDKLQKEKQKAQESSEEFDKVLEEKLKKAKSELKEKYNFQKEKEIAEVESNIKNLNEELREAKNKGKDLELEFMKQKDQLVDKKRGMDKDFILQKESLRKEIQVQIQSESKQKLGEKEKTIELLRTEINNIKQTAEQGSQQIQGEVTEGHLKDALKENFLGDLIEDVPVGVNGADIVQTIRNFQGITCGIILWESKNTTTCPDTWIDKLKADQKVVNANFSILVTKTLPKDISSFDDVRNVWVTSVELVVPLAKILRNAIIELHQKDQTLEGKSLKMDKLYSYLTSSGFKNRVSDCLDSFRLMEAELKKEIKSTKKRWAKQEALINRVEDNIITMYGSFEGIVGQSIPQLEDITDNLLETGDEDSTSENF